MATIKLEPLTDDNYEQVDIKEECSINTLVEDSECDSRDYTVQTRIVEQIKTREKNGPQKICYSNRMQHYREAWERNPAFSVWLTRGRNSRKARCMVCKSEMTADVSVLKYHSRSNKHLRKLSTVESSSATLVSKFASDSRSRKQEAFKKGIYNPCWEADPRFASWIECGNTASVAHCHLCNADIAADVGTLRRHLATYGHMRAAEFDNQVRVLSTKVSEEDSINIQSSADDDTVLVHEIIHRDEGDVDVVGPTEVRQGGLHNSGRDDRGDPRERLTFIIGKFLLKGYKMLHATCDKCVCVLLQDRKGASHCFGCQYGLMEEINSGRGAAKCRPRVPRTLASDWQHHSRRTHPRSPLKPPLVAPALDEKIFIKEEEEEVTEIVINEDTSAEVFVSEAIKDADEDCTQTAEYGEAALRGEVAALVLALRRRLATLTSQLRRGDDLDNCLDGLDTTVTALARLRQL